MEGRAGRPPVRGTQQAKPGRLELGLCFRTNGTTTKCSEKSRCCRALHWRALTQAPAPSPLRPRPRPSPARPYAHHPHRQLHREVGRQRDVGLVQGAVQGVGHAVPGHGDKGGNRKAARQGGGGGQRTSKARKG